MLELLERPLTVPSLIGDPPTWCDKKCASCDRDCAEFYNHRGPHKCWDHA